jgi:hypothetical protein
LKVKKNEAVKLQGIKSKYKSEFYLFILKWPLWKQSRTQSNGYIIKIQCKTWNFETAGRHTSRHRCR